MEIENLGEIADLAREFVYAIENWQVYLDLKNSDSNSLPAEFVQLCRAVEKYYGPRPDNWEEMFSA